jgi:glycerol-3-phosphate responsive antiterminator
MELVLAVSTCQVVARFGTFVCAVNPAGISTARRSTVVAARSAKKLIVEKIFIRLKSFKNMKK